MKKETLIKNGEYISRKYLLPERDLGITSRKVNYWKEKGILPFLEKDKKGFMDLREALWLLIINELSGIGIQTNKLQKLSEDVWIKPFHERYADTVLARNLTINKIDEESKNIIQNVLDSEVLMSNIIRKEVNPFTDAFKACLFSERVIVSLIYSPSKNYHQFNYNGIGITTDLNNFYLEELLIVIPFLPLASKLLGIEIEKSMNDIEYLTSLENQIRRVLVFDKPKLLEIELSDINKPKIIKITEEHKKTEELAKFFLANKLPVGAKMTIEKRSQGNYKLTIKA